MAIPVTAIFDIGKTNKKFFLFDKNYQEVYRSYSSFPLIKDEDGYPTEDLTAIQHWLKDLFTQILEAKKYKVKEINFSTYGASLVHIDRNGFPLTPLYNYTKPYPQDLLAGFYKQHGKETVISNVTGSPSSGMLNSGLQLYWLKHQKPDIYDKIWYSMHFPQYMSYLFTGIPLSDYTSIGCHTSLWDYSKKDYHQWVYDEGINQKLPPIVSTATSITMTYNDLRMKIGVGIHDSSSALLPYLKSDPKPFVLISTGTWSICFNPFCESNDLQSMETDSLQYMQIDGKMVKAKRLFLGNEYKLQVQNLCTHFNKEYGYHRHIKFDETIYQKLKTGFTNKFHFESLDPRENEPVQTDFNVFNNFEEAFHQLMIELIHLQVGSLKECIGHTAIEKIYIDGGFTDNDIFVKLITHHFDSIDIRTTKSPLGSAMGAAMVMSKKEITGDFLKENYALRSHSPLIIK